MIATSRPHVGGDARAPAARGRCGPAPCRARSSAARRRRRRGSSASGCRDRWRRGRGWRRSWWRDGPWMRPCTERRSAQAAPSRAVSCGALLQDLDRRQRLAFEELEEGAAAGGDVADLVGDAVLGDRRQRVAAAGDRERLRLGDRLRQRLRCRCANCVELEHADRAVPDDGAGALRSARPACAAVCGPMSRIRSSSATSADGLDGRRRVGGERPWRTTTSVGIGTSAPRAFIASMIALRFADQVGFGQRLADRAGRRPA